MKYALALALVGLSCSSAFAQTPPANPGPGTPAIAKPDVTSPGAPVAGANSFTEAQAKARIAAAGYSDVSALTKDKDGVWRGKGSKSGVTADVSLDYQGNITPK